MAQSRNVVARTLDRHAKANQSIRATAGNMSKLYIQTRQRLNDALQKAVLGGNAYTGKGLVNLIEAIQRQYAKLEEQYRSEFKRAIPYVTESFYHDALHDLDKSVIGPFDPYRVKAALADSYTHIAGATQRMAATEVSFLRNQAAQLFREVSMGGMTGKQASSELLGRLLSGDPQFKFTDARGRVWNTRSYTEMLGRTVLMNAGRSAYLDTCVDNGDDVVAVSVSGTSCPACAEWENRLLSITGADKSLPTVEDATAGGLFHPNCTHSLVAVSGFERESDYNKGGRPLEGWNSSGNEVKNDDEAWKEYRSGNKAETSKNDSSGNNVPASGNETKSNPDQMKPPPFEPAESKEKALEFAKQNIAENILLPGNTSLDVLNEVNRLISENMKELGFDRFLAIKEIKGSTGIASMHRGNAFFGVNPRVWMEAIRHPERIFYRNVIEPAERQGVRFLAVDKPENFLRHVVDHEFGHAVFNRSKLADKESLLNKVFENTISSDDHKLISGYAKTNHHELFAETFAMFRRGDKLPAEIENLISEIMK